MNPKGSGYLLYDRYTRLSLNRQAAHSGVAVIAAQLAGAGVAAGTVAVLARRLPPADFGLVAMALPLVVIGTAMRNFGLDFAAIQRENLDPRVVSALFWLSLRLNLLMVLALAALAPALVWFYHEPRLLEVTLTMMGGVLVLSLGAQPESLLKRQMRFGLLSAIHLGAGVAGSVCAMALAVVGAGFWALVAQTTVALFFRGALVWLACGWRPRWPRADPDVEGMLPSFRAYGRNLTATRLLSLISIFSDRVAVGRIAGPAVLGFYENGRRLAFLPLESLYVPLLDVAVAGFSRAAGDDERYRRSAGRAVHLVLAFLLPCLAFSLVEMRPATLLFLGDRWAPAVPFARVLVAGAFAQSLTRMLVWFYLSRDQTGRQVRWFAVQTAFTLAAVALGAWLGGAYGVALGSACAAFGLMIPAVIYALRESPFTAGDFARAAARPVLLSLGAAAALSLAEAVGRWAWAPLVHCSVAAMAFGLFYAAGWAALPGGRAAGMQMIRLLTRGRSEEPG